MNVNFVQDTEEQQAQRQQYIYTTHIHIHQITANRS